MRDPSGQVGLANLQRQVAEICGPGGVGASLVALPREGRDDNDETRRVMRKLHADLVARLTLLDERWSRRREE